MWFRNIIACRFAQPFAMPAAELSGKLQAAQFQPVGKMERQSIGFICPARHAGQPLTHQVGASLLICLQSEEKILPAAVIRAETDKTIANIELEQQRKVGKKERKELTGRVTDELLPRAFTRIRKTYALIMPDAGYLVVDTSSRARADEIIEWLRKAVESLAVRPLATQMSPQLAMTTWLTSGEAPANFCMDSECELKLPEEDGAMVRCVRQDVHADEVRRHLDSGKCATKLALTWADRMSFVLTDELAIRRLGYLDLLQDEAKSAGAEDDAEQFDANLTIMAGEFEKMLADIVSAMGGEG